MNGTIVPRYHTTHMCILQSIVGSMCQGLCAHLMDYYHVPLCLQILSVYMSNTHTGDEHCVHKIIGWLIGKRIRIAYSIQTCRVMFVHARVYIVHMCVCVCVCVAQSIEIMLKLRGSTTKS